MKAISNSTSGLNTISTGKVKSIKIPIPPINLQNQFAEKIALIEEQKALAKQELQESEDLFNCLLQKCGFKIMKPDILVCLST